MPLSHPSAEKCIHHTRRRVFNHTFCRGLYAGSLRVRDKSVCPSVCPMIENHPRAITTFSGKHHIHFMRKNTRALLQVASRERGGGKSHPLAETDTLGVRVKE